MIWTWRQRVIVAAPLLGILGLAVLAPTDEGPTLCPFALCTGMACPGCGLTRAAGSLVRGDFHRAMTYHPLVILIGAQMIVGWVWFLLRRTGRVGSPSPRLVNLALSATAGALIAVWLTRLVMGTLPPV